jgi:branched-chain amino acid transport system permease protein
MSFVNYLINGVSLGSVYAIIALGYTMVYGIAKMLNFAHGDVMWYSWQPVPWGFLPWQVCF